MKILLLAIGVFFAVVTIGLWWCTPVEECSEPVSDRDGTSVLSSTDINSDFTAMDLQAPVRVVFDNPKTLGWRQTGTVNLTRDEAISAVRAMMTDKGYVVRSSVDDSRFALELYGKDGICDVMWMIWSLGNAKAGFSWGISR